MSHFIKSILENNSPLFLVELKNLERATGHSGVDTRLIADITELSHHTMRQLGLDTKDTTARELYNALVSAVKLGKVELILKNTNYSLCLIDNNIISLNLIDVIENYHHNLALGSHTYKNGQKSLATELAHRYCDHPRTNDSTIFEILRSIGLLQDLDTCYNNSNHKRINKQ